MNSETRPSEIPQLSELKRKKKLPRQSFLTKSANIRRTCVPPRPILPLDHPPKIASDFLSHNILKTAQKTAAMPAGTKLPSCVFRGFCGRSLLAAVHGRAGIGVHP
jgi:hypothetical protein